MHPKYGDVEEMIAALPRDEKVIVNRLRSLVAECVPKATEKAYYGVGMPFYSHNKLICFIWPPSVMWDTTGKRKESKNQKGVQLGFCQGYLMSNDDGVLLAEGRKQVYAMYFKTLKEIDETQVRALLFEAAILDDSFKKKPKPKK